MLSLEFEGSRADEIALVGDFIFPIAEELKQMHTSNDHE